MTVQNMTEQARISCGIPKKIAMINDIAGYGRCSTTVSLPIISVMGVQVCPVPTSVFSNHTGFPVHFMHDCTPILPQYLEKWQELELTFDGIYCGFLGSVEQIGIVRDFLVSQIEIQESKALSARPAVILDPVMGDHGKAYRTVTPEHCAQMKELLSLADIITPNITEACLLADIPYRESGWTAEELTALADRLHAMGPDRIVITGMQEQEDFINFISCSSGAATADENAAKAGRIHSCCRMHAAGEYRPGTGDIFASIIAADAVNGIPFPASVEKAAAFVRTCTKASSELHIPQPQGVCFENFLYLLTPPACQNLLTPPAQHDGACPN